MYYRVTVEWLRSKGEFLSDALFEDGTSLYDTFMELISRHEKNYGKNATFDIDESIYIALNNEEITTTNNNSRDRAALSFIQGRSLEPLLADDRDDISATYGNRNDNQPLTLSASNPRRTPRNTLDITSAPFGAGISGQSATSGFASSTRFRDVSFDSDGSNSDAGSDVSGASDDSYYASAPRATASSVSRLPLGRVGRPTTRAAAPPAAARADDASVPGDAGYGSEVDARDDASVDGHGRYIPAAGAGVAAAPGDDNAFVGDDAGYRRVAGAAAAAAAAEDDGSIASGDYSAAAGVSRDDDDASVASEGDRNRVDSEALAVAAARANRFADEAGARANRLAHEAAAAEAMQVEAEAAALSANRVVAAVEAEVERVPAGNDAGLAAAQARLAMANAEAIVAGQVAKLRADEALAVREAQEFAEAAAKRAEQDAVAAEADAADADPDPDDAGLDADDAGLDADDAGLDADDVDPDADDIDENARPVERDPHYAAPPILRNFDRQRAAGVGAHGIDAAGQVMDRELYMKNTQEIAKRIVENQAYEDEGIRCKLERDGTLVTTIPRNNPLRDGRTHDQFVRSIRGDIPHVVLTNPPEDASIDLMLSMNEDMIPLKMISACRNELTALKLFEASIVLDKELVLTQTDIHLLENSADDSIRERYHMLNDLMQRRDVTELDAFRLYVDDNSPWRYGISRIDEPDDDLHFGPRRN